VGDDEDTSLEGLEGGDEGSERLAVEVVGRLVEDDDVGTTPGSGGENDLDLLSSRETTHGVVGGELGLETEVGEVSLNLLTDEGTEETSLLGLTRVDLHDLQDEKEGDGKNEKGKRRKRENDAPSSRNHDG
jgi:hypothetical protein